MHAILILLYNRANDATLGGDQQVLESCPSGRSSENNVSGTAAAQSAGIFEWSPSLIRTLTIFVRPVFS